jgi:hypothetical protein
MKEAWKRQRDGSNTTRLVFQAGALWKGTPARELEPIAIHGLELDTGG